MGKIETLTQLQCSIGPCLPGPWNNLEGNQHEWLSCRNKHGHTADGIHYSMQSKYKREFLGVQSPIAHKLTLFKRLSSEMKIQEQNKEQQSMNDPIISTKHITNYH